MIKFLTGLVKNPVVKVIAGIAVVVAGGFIAVNGANEIIAENTANQAVAELDSIGVTDEN